MSERCCLRERRKFSRYAVKSGLLAITDKRIGEIIDISINGLAFRYIFWGDQSIKSPNCDLKILVTDESYLLEEIPIKFVSDNFLQNSFTFSSLVMKRSGVEFYDMPPLQVTQLENFISKYSLWEL